MGLRNADNNQLTEGICRRAPKIRAVDDQGVIGCLNAMGQAGLLGTVIVNGIADTNSRKQLKIGHP